MPVNDFLPFATGVGANVVTQPNYASDPATPAGFTAGIAQSAKLNKVWRQSSFISAAIAQFVMERLQVDVFDNGNLADFVRMLEEAMVSLSSRETLIEDRIYYVNPTTGSDSNDGLTSSTAFQTLQRAADIIMDDLDCHGHWVTIQMAAGTYTRGVLFTRPSVNCGGVYFAGNLANPASVIVDVVEQNCFYVAAENAVWIEGITMQASNPNNASPNVGQCIYANSQAAVFFSTVVFGPTPNGVHLASRSNAYVRAYGNYTITGGSLAHFHAATMGIVSLAAPPQHNARTVSEAQQQGRKLSKGDFTALPAIMPASSSSPSPSPQVVFPPMTITLQGNPAFSYGFFLCTNIGLMEGGAGYGVGFSGAATGPRFVVNTCSVLNTTGGGLNYFPGSTAGVVDAATYGVYL